MEKIKKDWKLIFNINNNDCVFIKNKPIFNSLNIVFKNIKEIGEIEDFLILLPSINEYISKNNSNYIYNFSPILKSFIESNTKKTIVTEEGVINTLIKPEKRINFFKFLKKQKKNIIIFGEDNYEEYITKISDYKFLIINEEIWKKNTELFERFSEIKSTIYKINNPFKDPIGCFKKYQQEIVLNKN